MILIDVEGGGQIAVADDLPEASYAATGRLTATRPAGQISAGPARVVVEVLRRFGGHAPRALLGGQFTPSAGASTSFEVTYAADSDHSSCPSMLWNQAYAAGLAAEFAPAVLDGLLEEAGALPAGVLLVDRAGIDEVEASEWVFRQAAVMLRGALSATLRRADLEAEIRSLAEKW
ncbi:hypothetical protein [Nonomuraea sp. NPDC049607]|uniref:hypothetical protein n=1 Tax=Nonomuraea sp. NPDC049607 TaxID=3154732 RepID=UPI003412A046